MATQLPAKVLIEASDLGASDTIRRQRQLDVLTYKRVVDEIVQLGPKTEIVLRVFGSGKTVGFRAHYMVDYAKRRGIAMVTLVTNADLWEEAHISFLMESGLDCLILVVDGGGSSEGSRPPQTPGLIRLEKVHSSMKSSDQAVPNILWQTSSSKSSGREYGSARSFGELVICQWADTTCVVRWNGDIVACPLDSEGENVFGSVHSESLQNIWNVSLGRLRQAHKEADNAGIPDMCNKCVDWEDPGSKCATLGGDTVLCDYDFSKQSISALRTPR